jgi:hypothetical protein
MRKIDRHDRETVTAALLAAVPTATRADALRLLRWGRTYGRLAEAECNGDFPAEHPRRIGQQAVCGGCGRTWSRFDFHGHPARCGVCRAERIIRETCEGFGWLRKDEGPPHCTQWRVIPAFQGDPRGHTVRLAIAGAPLDAYERPALAVPTS